MDLISAIGLASSIIAFIEFNSWELLAGISEIYRSGLPGGHLRSACTARGRDGGLRVTRPVSRSTSPCQDESRENIIRLAQDCQEDSKSLLDLLSGLKAVQAGKRKRVWRSLNVAWKTILKKKEVAHLKAQLQESRAEIQLNLITMIQ